MQIEAWRFCNVLYVMVHFDYARTSLLRRQNPVGISGSKYEQRSCEFEGLDRRPFFPHPHSPNLTLFTITQHAQPNFRIELLLRVACGGAYARTYYCTIHCMHIHRHTYIMHAHTYIRTQTQTQTHTHTHTHSYSQVCCSACFTCLLEVQLWTIMPCHHTIILLPCYHVL